MSDLSKDLVPVSNAIQALDKLRAAGATGEQINAFTEGDDRQTVDEWCRKHYPELYEDDDDDQANAATPPAPTPNSPDYQPGTEGEPSREYPDNYVLLLGDGCPRLFTVRPSRQETARTNTGNAVVEIPGIQVRGIRLPNDKKAAMVNVRQHPAVRRAQFPVTQAELCELIEGTHWFQESKIVTLAEYNELRDLEREAKEAAKKNEDALRERIAAKRGKRGQS